MIIRKLRIEKGWSQEQLAEASGVSTRTIQRIENGGEASVETKKCLAAVFEIDFNNLKQDNDMENNDKGDNNLSDEDRIALNTLREWIKYDESWQFYDPSLSSEEREALRYVRAIRRFYVNLGMYVIMVVFLLILNLITSPSYLWVMWPALGWGLVVAFHGLSVFEIFFPLGGDWEKRQIEKRLKKK